jgi:hypothetical protein
MGIRLIVAGLLVACAVHGHGVMAAPADASAELTRLVKADQADRRPEKSDW